MATVGALAIRRELVEARLAAAAARVASPTAPLPPESYSRQPEIAAIERLEYLADLLEAATGTAPDAPVAEHEQLEVTTEIAADLFAQVHEEQADADETGGQTPVDEPHSAPAPAQSAAAAAPKGRR